jgi:hypothetical protein
MWLLILGFGVLMCVVAAAADRQTDAHIAGRQAIEAAVAAPQVDVSDDQRRGSARTD